MKSLAKKQKEASPILEYGIVAEADKGVLFVFTDGEIYEAQPAVSCLISPEKGDMVLLSFNAAGRCYILSVLERPGGDEAPKTLSLDGQVKLRIRRGGLNIAADEALSLTAKRGIALATAALTVDAGKGEARIEDFSFFGRCFQSRVEAVRHIADTLDTVIRRVVQRLTSSYRYIEEHEEVQSASTRMLVEGTLTMQTQNTMHTAEGHIKIDAEQIHLG